MIVQWETGINVEGDAICEVGFHLLVFFFKGCEFIVCKNTMEASAHCQQILYKMGDVVLLCLATSDFSLFP